MRKIIRLTESDLHKLIKESVNIILESDTVTSGLPFEDEIRKEGKELKNEFILMKNALEYSDSFLEEIGIAEEVDEYVYDYLKELPSTVHFLLMFPETCYKNTMRIYEKTKEIKELLSRYENDCQLMIPNELTGGSQTNYNAVEWMKIRCGFIEESLERIITYYGISNKDF